MKITEKISLNSQDVTWLESVINYTKIYFVDGSFLLVSYTLKTIEDRIKSHKNFIRIHRSYMVNQSYINSITIQDKETFVRLTDNLELLVSRRKRNILKGITQNNFTVL
ncbi:LytR/AlgR family response regulator transcription factor [Emticicia sp. SJ17W-69]|uniref:LytR/AlgR family response regulator transcription factor n=1 Tax=Emticicia sp. SJ17W-69 TaxID=3421657 RepID=UPI003EB7FFCF